MFLSILRFTPIHTPQVYKYRCQLKNRHRIMHIYLAHFDRILHLCGVEWNRRSNLLSTLMAGTTVNYYLDDGLNRASILFPGVACFLVAVVLGSFCHASNAADIAAKLEIAQDDVIRRKWVNYFNLSLLMACSRLGSFMALINLWHTFYTILSLRSTIVVYYSDQLLNCFSSAKCAFVSTQLPQVWLLFTGPVVIKGSLIFNGLC